MQILRRLMDAWASRFDSTKYPKDFYLHLLSAVQKAKDEEQLRVLIVRLLQWKDGKIREDKEGSIVVSGRNYSARQTKPNTYAPENHDRKLRSKEFYNWSKGIMALETFSKEHIATVRDRFQLWSGESLVIPSFLLHVLNPQVFPIFDQNVERARRFFAGLVYNSSSADIGTDDYVEYHLFWTELVNEMGIDLSHSDYGEVKRLDDALWSIGKYLKSSASSEYVKKEIKKPGAHSYQPSMGEQFRTPPDRHTMKYNTSSPEFINHVLSYCKSMSQSAAMKRAAEDLDVPLPPSYFAHPGSHIDRWRKQGYPKQL